MGFYSGRATFTRFKVSGTSPGIFGPEHLEQLAGHRAGSQRIASSDGVEVGWTAGDHVLDTHFELAKNVVNDTLHFALRVDSERVPSDLLRAYYQMDLQALASQNPSGRPSNRQKREAKESALARLEHEAKDGRFRRRKTVPVLWDSQSNELLFGTTSVTAVDQLFSLFEQTFSRKFEPLTAGRQAYALAELHAKSRSVDDAAPSVFIPGISPSDVAWVLDETSRDFLGNEFLLWLWFKLDADDDTLPLSDGSEVTAMLARTLALECPRGQTGKESITHEGPGRLPEARRAIATGKMPRKAGLTLVRHDQQYELAMSAESLGVSGARLPAPEGDDERARLDERVNQLRHLIETLDLLYEAFVRTRCGDKWVEELHRLQKWLQKDERRAA